jgi:nucleotide-binding universal stress UspA family protein
MSSSSRPVVVGVDGSEASKDALRWAVRHAQLTAAELHVVLAWRRPITYGIAPDYGEVDFEAAARSTLQQVIEEVLGAHPPVPVISVVAEGHPAQILIQAAKGADLLVVGHRGHGTFAGMLLGSTSQHCVHHASTPVVVIRHAKP